MRLVKIGGYWINPHYVQAIVPESPSSCTIYLTTPVQGGLSAHPVFSVRVLANADKAAMCLNNETSLDKIGDLNG